MALRAVAGSWGAGAVLGSLDSLSVDLTMSRREHHDGKIEGIMRKNWDLRAS